MKSVALALVAGSALAGCQTAALAPAGPELLLTGVGRYAVFADLSTRTRSGDHARIRSLQVVEPGFEVDGRAFWGGWSWWAFDCAAGTADRLDFASVSEGGIEGPAVPDTDPPYPAAPGGDAAELLAVTCSDARAGPILTTVEAAVTAGQQALTE
ncbi:MAG: hypothetical protein Q8R97_00330 [Brevundimonas sp.]|uniref:hypothetical protein n=1 Tax=Brevundimonas sp. TaxID=1871086 RepID=UPI00274C568B|nr:hypothetical protein [Brevundimonas sp.]MDP3399548.1 hypothetical protein [Brevundimonas sp.]MDZ4108499.1 hypothetical protein [Brevundimonas sp.]